MIHLEKSLPWGLEISSVLLIEQAINRVIYSGIAYEDSKAEELTSHLGQVPLSVAPALPGEPLGAEGPAVLGAILLQIVPRLLFYSLFIQLLNCHAKRVGGALPLVKSNRCLTG